MNPQSILEGLNRVSPMTAKRGNPCDTMIHCRYSESMGLLDLVALGIKRQITLTVDAGSNGGFGDFTVSIDPKVFSSILKSASGDLTISEEDGYFRVTDGSGSIKLSLTEMFPLNLPVPPRDSLTVPAREFWEPIKKALDVTGDEKRFNLDAVFFDGKRQAVVGTDGHRMSVESALWLPCDWSVMVHWRGLAVLEKCFKGALGDVEVSRDTTRFWVSCDGATACVPIQEGEYAPYETKIPEIISTVVCDSEEFRRALRVCRIMASDWNFKTRTCETQFLFEPDSLTLRLEHPTLGSGQHTLPVTYSGDVPKNRKFDIDYLFGAVKTCNGVVKIGITSEDGGGWFFGDQLLMPMKDTPKNSPVAIPPETKQVVPSPKPQKTKRMKAKTPQAPKARKTSKTATKKAKVKTVRVKKVKADDAWKFDHEQPRDGYTWVKEHKRGAGIVRGHWRKRPVRAQSYKIAA